MRRGRRTARQPGGVEEEKNRRKSQQKDVVDLETDVRELLIHARKKNTKGPVGDQGDEVESVLANFLRCNDEGMDVSFLEPSVKELRQWRDGPEKRAAIGRVAGEDGQILAGPKPRRGVVRLNTELMAASLGKGIRVVEVAPQQPGIQLDADQRDFLRQDHDAQDLIHVTNILQQLLTRVDDLGDQFGRLQQEMERLKTLTTAAEHKDAIVKKIRDVLTAFLTENDCSHLKEFVFIEWIENHDDVDGFWKEQFVTAEKSLKRAELDTLDNGEILGIVKARLRELRNKHLVEPIRGELCQEFLKMTTEEADHPNLSYNPVNGAPKKRGKKSAKKGPNNGHEEASRKQTEWIDHMDKQRVPEINNLADGAMQQHCRILHRIFGKHANFCAFAFYYVVFTQWRNGCNLRATEGGESTYQTVQKFINDTKVIEDEVKEAIEEAKVDADNMNALHDDEDGVREMEIDQDEPLGKDKDEESE